MGLEIDGAAAQREERSVDRGNEATLADALRSPAFWVFALSSSIYGLAASGIGLFNESILAQRGFAPDIYYQALAVTAIPGTVFAVSLDGGLRAYASDDGTLVWQFDTNRTFETVNGVPANGRRYRSEALSLKHPAITSAVAC